MLKIEIECADAGWWLGEVPDLPGVRACGATAAEARIKAVARSGADHPPLRARQNCNSP